MIAALLLLVGSGACTSTGDLPSTSDIDTSELIFNPETTKEGALAACLLIDWVAILSDIHTKHFDPDDLSEALGGITAALAVLDKVDFEETLFPATEWRRASIAMIRHLDLDERIRERVADIALRGLSVSTATEIGKRLGASALMTEAFLDDVRAQIKALKAGTYTLDFLLDGCVAHVRESEKRMADRL